MYEQIFLLLFLWFNNKALFDKTKITDSISFLNNFFGIFLIICEIFIDFHEVFDSKYF